MEALLDILTELRPDVDFQSTDDLVDGGYLDSLDIITLVGEINDAFGIEINVEDIIPENFNSAKAMYALIEALSE